MGFSMRFKSEMAKAYVSSTVGHLFVNVVITEYLIDYK